MKFAVPQLGVNRCSLTVLSHNDKYNRDLRQFLNPECPGGKQGEDIDKMENTEIRWMRVEDTDKRIAFECRMMPGWHKIEILLKIKDMPQDESRDRVTVPGRERESTQQCALM